MIGAAILGVFAGFLGRALLPGKQDIGFLATLAVGVAGSLVGFLIFTELLGIGDNEKFDLGGLPGAVIGTMVLLFVYDKVAGRNETAAAPGLAPPASRDETSGGGGRRRSSGERRTRDRRD